MPTFDYVCPGCGAKEEKRVSSHTTKVQCVCGTTMIKQICAPNIGGMDKQGSSGSTKLPD